MKKLNKILISLFFIACSGCNAESSSISSSNSSEIVSFSENLNPTRDNPLIYNLTNVDTAQTIDLVGPFEVLNEDGSETDFTQHTFTNMYEAIRFAGSKSTSQKFYQVQDSNFVQIFKRVKSATYGYCFNGPKYVGYGSKTKCKAYCLANPEAYAINNKGSDYLYMGRHDMVKDQTVTENVLETNAGAYNYMFSKGGSGSNNLGYRYATADVLLSEAQYIAPTDGGTWNAYIFINMAEGISADLGLIGVRTNNRVEWWLFRSCGSKTHTGGNNDKEATFHVFQKTLITYSTTYDSSTRAYSGFDDLHFETAAFNDGWWLEITNMRTNQKLTLDHRHTDESGNKVIENNDGISTRVLIASSFCPVTGNVWNWKCGAALNNVVWTNISLKKAIKGESGLANTVEEYRNVTDSYEFYPDSSLYRDGYSQGGYCASHEFSTFDENGQSAGGFNYQAGQKYISFSVDYR